MDPITTAIVSALPAAAASSVGEIAKKAIVDAYETLKAAIKSRLGAESEVARAIEGLELKPGSEGRKVTLSEEIDAAKADEDDHLLALAQALLEQIRTQAGGAHVVQQAT